MAKLVDLSKKNEDEQPARGKPFILALCAVTIVAVAAVFIFGGWFGGGRSDKGALVEDQLLSRIAKNEVDQALISSGMADYLHYGKIAASSQGDFSMTDVRFQATPTASITIDEIRVSGLKQKNGVFFAADVNLKGVSAPIQEMAQERMSPDIEGLAALGYKTINADIFLHAAFDDVKGVINYRTTGVVQDLGGWSIDLDVGGIDMKIVNEAQRVPEKGDEAIVAIMRLSEMMSNTLTLINANVMLDNAGLIARMNAMPDSATPMDDDSEIIVDGDALERAGLSTVQSDKMVNAFDQWINEGGQITVATNIRKPIRLVDERYPGAERPSFRSFEEFLAKTNASVTYKPASSLR